MRGRGRGRRGQGRSGNCTSGRGKGSTQGNKQMKSEKDCTYHLGTVKSASQYMEITHILINHVRKNYLQGKDISNMKRIKEKPTHSYGFIVNTACNTRLKCKLTTTTSTRILYFLCIAGIASCIDQTLSCIWSQIACSPLPSLLHLYQCFAVM